MSYLNHHQIQDILRQGYLYGHDPACVNTASLDVRLGATILVENVHPSDWILDYKARDKMAMVEKTIDRVEGFILMPGQFILAHTIERCAFPDNLAALFRIKSSMGRIGFDHLDAGWVDPGFHGALTLEFKNMSQNHAIRIRPGDRIGQLVFLTGSPVSPDKSYRMVGRYNASATVEQIR